MTTNQIHVSETVASHAFTAMLEITSSEAEGTETMDHPGTTASGDTTIIDNSVTTDDETLFTRSTPNEDTSVFGPTTNAYTDKSTIDSSTTTAMLLTTSGESTTTTTQTHQTESTDSSMSDYAQETTASVDIVINESTVTTD